MVREGRDFPEVEAKLLELIEEMRTDLCLKPLTREFISLSKGVSYDAGPIPFSTFYLEEHDERCCQRDGQESHVPVANGHEQRQNYQPVPLFPLLA